MDWFSLSLNIILIGAVGILQLSFAGWFTGKDAKIWHFAIYLLSLYADAAAASLFHFNRLAIGIQLLALYAVCCFALKNSRLVSSATALLALHVSQLSFGIINPLEFLLFSYAIGQTVLYPLVIIASLIALAICLFCFKLIANKFSLRAGLSEPYLWLLLAPELFFFAVESYMLNTAYGQALTIPYALEADKQIALLLLQLLSFGALFCTLLAFRHACGSLKAQAALASLTQQADAQRVYVAQAQMRYEQTQSLRHDMKNHLAVLDGLLKQENFVQAKAYLQKLDSVANSLSFPVHTNNLVIDTLLGEKLDLAKSAGIEAEVSLSLPASDTSIDDFDLCIIFANAVDNAIQACMCIDGDRSIRIFGEQQGDFFMLEFENTCADGPQEKIGIGLMNIKSVADKYGGAITIEKSNSRFLLHVIINISLHR